MLAVAFAVYDLLSFTVTLVALVVIVLEPVQLVQVYPVLTVASIDTLAPVI